MVEENIRFEEALLLSESVVIDGDKLLDITTNDMSCL